MSIESVMLSNHLILCHPFLLWPPKQYRQIHGQKKKAEITVTVDSCSNTILSQEARTAESVVDPC